MSALSDYLAHRKCRTNAGLVALMAYGGAAALLVVASFLPNPAVTVGLSLMYAGLGALHGAIEMKQCKQRANYGK